MSNISKAIIISICCFSFQCFSQSPESDSTQKKVKTTVLPIIGYSPETSLAFGVLTNILFYTKDSTAYNRPSNIQPIFITSILKQFIFFGKSNVYLKNGFNLNIRIDALNFPNYYFGIGNNTLKINKENLGHKYYLIKPAFLKQVNENIFIGPQVDFDYHIVNYSNNSLIYNDMPVGIKGGVLLGVGSKFTFDSRDDILYPSKGVFIDIDALYYLKSNHTDYEYFNLKLNFKKYYSINSKNIFASSFVSNNNIGNSPFYRYPLIGGANRIRGLYYTRFSDKFAYYSQHEYRRHIWKRFSGVVFLAVGQVSNKFINFTIKDTKYGFGTGLRFKLSKSQKLNLRLDYAWASDKSSGFYLSIGEAF